MSETMKLVLSLSVSGGLFALVLFVLKPFMRNRLSKSFQYYIWLVVLLRFILPFTFGINLMEYAPAGRPPSVETDNWDNENMGNGAGETSISGHPNHQTNEWQEREYTIPFTPGDNAPRGAFMVIDPLKILGENLLWIWLAGVVITAARNVVNYLRFIRSVHREACPVEMIDCGIKVYKSRFAPTPILAGVIKPRIYLPNIDYSDDQLDNILLHELTHLRRRDLWIKWFTALIVSLHWFNPMAYFMRRELNRACELSCDEAVIRKLDSAAKQRYGDTLIAVAAESRTPAGVMSVTMSAEKKRLKERLISIMNYRKKTKIAVLIAAVLAVVIGGSALAFGAQISLQIGVFANNIEEDARESQGIASWEVSKSINGNLCAMLFYDETLDNHTFSIYVRGNGLRFGYFFTIGGGSSMIADGIAEFTFDTNGLALISMNKDRAAKIALDNGADSTYIDIDPEKPFAVVIPDNSGTVTIYNDVGSIVKANEYSSQDSINYDISLAELRQLAAKSDGLLIEDFAGYDHKATGSGLYIMVYSIEGGYQLWLGTTGPEETGMPMYAFLKIPGVDENLDIRYNDIDEFIGGHPIPDELSAEIHGHIDTIMSSPAHSSATGDYIRTHQTEYNTIANMGVSALPTLKNILDGGDMGLRGNIAWLLAKDIIAADNKSHKTESEGPSGYVYLVSLSIENWEGLMGYSVDDAPATSDEVPDKPVIDGSIPADLTQGE